MERDRLEAALAREFDADIGHCRVVARQATDLDDSGQLERDLEIDLTIETVVSNLNDAPAGSSLRERWNWWLGSVALTHEGYRRFSVRLLE